MSEVISRIQQAEYEAARRRYQVAPPVRRCEIIAHHYASHAALAQTLSRIIESARGQESESINDCILYLYDQLRNNYLHDFGIEPNWNLPVSTL